MADQNCLIQERSTFDVLCKTFDSHGWSYERDSEKLKIKCSATGEDLPVSMVIAVDAERMLVTLASYIPVSVPQDKRIDVAIGICKINDCLVDGSFDYDVIEGNVFFRMTNSFVESLLDAEVFEYMLSCSFATIDEYNDKLLMLAKGTISLDKFLELV
jgi:hypothetical protein